MTTFVKPVTLSANGVELVPLEATHEAGLKQAAADGELWQIRVTSVPEPDATADYIGDALRGRDTGDRFAFAVIDQATGNVIGTTSYHDILPAVKRLEIGYTWYAKSYQRTSINTECKMLLLQHAFEKIAAIAFEFRTSWFNYPSREAIARLGAKQDGILRQHQKLPNGSYRDTVVFSILDSEWAGVKVNLEYRLQKYKS